MLVRIRRYRHQGAHRPGGPRHLYRRPAAADPWAGYPLFPLEQHPTRLALFAALASR